MNADFTVCDVCGRESTACEEPWPNPEICPNCEAEEAFWAREKSE